MELGKHYLHAQQDKDALETFKQALIYPENLGEGKLTGAQENSIYYYVGCAYEGLGLTEKASEYFYAASQGLEEPASACFTMTNHQI